MIKFKIYKIEIICIFMLNFNLFIFVFVSEDLENSANNFLLSKPSSKPNSFVMSKLVPGQTILVVNFVSPLIST